MSPTEQMREALRFTKKPVTIDAIQWDGSLAGFDAIHAAFPALETCASTLNRSTGAVYHWRIRTLEDGHVVSPGDWIIRGVKGEFYPCKPDIFEATYCPALTAPAAEVPEAMGDERICELWSWSATSEAERTATTQQHAFARAIEAAKEA